MNFITILLLGYVSLIQESRAVSKKVETFTLRLTLRTNEESRP